jgi:integrase
MAAGYRVTNLRLQSGERLSLLVATATGVPLWNPTLFVVTELRATNRAAATLQQATRAIMVAHQVLDYLGIDLDARLAEGRLLDVGELDALVNLAGMTQEGLDGLLTVEAKAAGNRRTVVSLEKARMRAKPVELPPQVVAETKGIRLMYIRDYFAWLARRALLKVDYRRPVHQALSETARLVIGQLSARMPSSSQRNQLRARQGVSPEVRQRIVEVTHPGSPENPWKNDHVRVRNHLIFMWLLELGLRKGELLGIRLDDINLRSGEVEIARRPDNPDEPRRDAPLNKGKDRLLALGDGLADLTRAYVHGPRRAIKGARKSPYLLVATGTGRPLTKAAVSKLFVELRSKVPGLPEELCPHVLRHTWNDDFSEFMDERGVSPEEEEKMRKQQMGWSDSSKMAAVYTRRHTRRKTNEASLAMQAAAFDAAKGKK